MSQLSSAFKNLCLRVPVDPISKMPKSAYERNDEFLNQQRLIDSSPTCSMAAENVDAVKLKEFYRSIPDYNDINHLPPDEFYSTLKSLREQKKFMLGLAIEFIDDNGSCDKLSDQDLMIKTDEISRLPKAPSRSNKSGRKLSAEYKDNNGKIKNNSSNSSNNSLPMPNSVPETCLKRARKSDAIKNIGKKCIDAELKITPHKSNLEKSKNEQPKRNHSACSISWNDAKIESDKNYIDQKFNSLFDGKRYDRYDNNDDIDNDEFKTRSMPSSPIRTKRTASPARRRKSITIPKPFKMTERDEEQRVVNELKCLQKSFSEDMLHQKCERKKFRAKPVPIQSRIPLYDKILQDQAMRSAIIKINSEAELRAQMKPFSFTKREEKGLDGGICDRAVHILPKCKKKKRFKARPIPKNLFSNYFYDKMKEDEFFRSMNKRIRAEETLRQANYPGSMAVRNRSRLSTPAAHSDLPTDPSPGIPSISSNDRQKSSSSVKERKKGNKYAKDDFVTTSPQPFRFNTANRATKKMHDVAMKIFQKSNSTASCGSGTVGNGPGAHAYSALDLRASASGRSNLAALLRAETVRRRFEIETAKHLAEQRRRNEMRQRNRQLRSKPAWHLVKNNHEEDIAMRLQTRRDEERMRREEFLHEMELMYGRVQQQPMLFERYYAPRSISAPLDTLQLTPRKVTKKRISSKNKSYHYNSPNRSRKVSINDTPETYNCDVAEIFDKIDINDKYSDSEIVSDILDGTKI